MISASCQQQWSTGLQLTVCMQIQRYDCALKQLARCLVQDASCMLLDAIDALDPTALSLFHHRDQSTGKCLAPCDIWLIRFRFAKSN